jgi:hypothetical protein
MLKVQILSGTLFYITEKKERKMKIYAGSIMGQNIRTNTIAINTFAIKADNEDAAVGIMYRRAYEEMPPAEGWANHVVKTFPVPEKWYTPAPNLREL